MSLFSFAFGSIHCSPHQCCTHRIETGFSYELSLIYNNASSNIFSPSLLTKLRRLPPRKCLRVTMITFLIILEVVIMVTSGGHFYCDSLGENTRGSGEKVSSKETQGLMLNIQELSRSFAMTTGSRLTGAVGEWAGKSKGRDISARLSHRSGSRFEKASGNLNIKSIGVPKSSHSILGGL